MANKKKKDSHEERVNWLRPCDIRVVRTADPREMEGKYIAEEVVKRWTEDFQDEDTGSVVSIERKEKLFKKGTLLTKDIVCEVQFHIQAGDIEDIPVIDVDYNITRYFYDRLHAYEVTATFEQTKCQLLVRAQGVEQAAQIAVEYGGMHLHLSGWVYVRQVKLCDYLIVEDDDECIPEEALEDTDSDYDYYKVMVQSRFFGGYDDEPDKENYTFIIRAQDVGQAKERITEYCNRKWEDELKEPRNSFAVLKGQPYETEAVVPLPYCELYYEKHDY